jgi:hypothetical protein
MSDLVFDCIEARAEPYAAGPTLLFRLRITETSGQRIQAIALRCQMRIQPQRRQYSDEEAARLADLFGGRERWADTLKPLQFTHQSIMVPRFTGATEIELPVPCTYDLEVASGQYFHALEDGGIPLLMLFSGTVFADGAVTMVPWDRECDYSLPVAIWRELMDGFFPGSGWLRLTCGNLDALRAFKHARALPTWDDTIAVLLKEAAADEL